MPVKFLTITQQGYDFLVHDADKSVKDETWSIERVAAFMSVHYTLNVKARKYAKGMTFIPTVAATQYSFQADAVTSADIDKLTAFLVPKLCGIYEDPFKQGFLGRPLPQVLDDVEKMALDYIEQEEAEIEVFGQKCKPKPFYSRPSKEEYDAAIAESRAAEKALWDNYYKVLNSGKAKGHTIRIKEGANVYTGTIVRTSEKCIYCDVKDEYGRLLQKEARFPRNSTRLLIESFR